MHNETKRSKEKNSYLGIVTACLIKIKVGQELLINTEKIKFIPTLKLAYYTL